MQNENEYSEPSEVYSIISTNFELASGNVLSFEEIHRVLTERIHELLEKNVEKLIFILYRIDVGQKRTDEIFNNPSKEEIASLLATAVIERQLEKVKTRRKYSSK
ncbi:MAG TPA: hypothetical protein PKE39_01620 [Ignavibacteria bacterium]|nr:hypothetical protein [Ignavibacteria bacterium]HMQ97697.1 hypothetical protein [Ignavibacteria bacterium]